MPSHPAHALAHGCPCSAGTVKTSLDHPSQGKTQVHQLAANRSASAELREAVGWPAWPPSAPPGLHCQPRNFSAAAFCQVARSVEQRWLPPLGPTGLHRCSGEASVSQSSSRCWPTPEHTRARATRCVCSSPARSRARLAACLAAKSLQAVEPTHPTSARRAADARAALGAYAQMSLHAAQWGCKHRFPRA